MRIVELVCGLGAGVVTLVAAALLPFIPVESTGHLIAGRMETTTYTALQSGFGLGTVIVLMAILILLAALVAVNAWSHARTGSPRARQFLVITGTPFILAAFGMAIVIGPVIPLASLLTLICLIAAFMPAKRAPQRLYTSR